MKIDKNFSPYIQNFLQQKNAVNIEQKNIIIPPYKIELSEHTKKFFAKASGEENISTIKEFEKSFEIEESKENFRQEMMQGISQRIGEVLKPYETYEEAYENLYAKETAGWWSSFDEEKNLIKTGPKNSVQGAFGILANSLNNYLSEFGADDGYFDSLMQNLEEIDTNDDAIIGQIKNMISTVRGGNYIDVQSSEFEKNVSNAITSVYTKNLDSEKILTKNKKNQPETEEKNLSNFEIEIQNIKETEQMLDKFFGKENNTTSKSVGEINSQDKNISDADFEENLKNLDKQDGSDNIDTEFENYFELEETSERKLDEETILNRQIIFEKWNEL